MPQRTIKSFRNCVYNFEVFILVIFYPYNLILQNYKHLFNMTKLNRIMGQWEIILGYPFQQSENKIFKKLT